MMLRGGLRKRSMCSIKIPFIENDTKIPLIHISVNGIDTVAIIDSGSDTSLISNELVKKYSIPIEKTHARCTSNGLYSSVTRSITYAKARLKFHNLATEECEVMLSVLGMSNVRDAFKERCDIEPYVILGSDFLDEHNAKIDYVKSNLIIDDLSYK